MNSIGNLIYSTFSSKEKIEHYQTIIRDYEWKELMQHIPKKSKLLDIGCGAGYTLKKASEELQCECYGIDPSPGSHGVGRFNNKIIHDNIIKGVAENLPFDNKSFNIVYSSHVLEHVNNENKMLSEINRVLKDDGVVIIGMPTSTMAVINLISQILFTTHIKIYEFFKYLFSKNVFTNFINIFRINSHSYPIANSIWYDIFHYHQSNWRKTISKQFLIIDEITPGLYPYPDFFQLFPLHKNKLFSSSVFFICKNKK